MQSNKLTTIVAMCRDDGRIYASAFWMLVVLHVRLVLLLLVSEYVAWWSGLGMDWITLMIGIMICLSSIHHVLIHTRGRLVGAYITHLGNQGGVFPVFRFFSRFFCKKWDFWATKRSPDAIKISTETLDLPLQHPKFLATYVAFLGNKSNTCWSRGGRQL